MNLTVLQVMDFLLVGTNELEKIKTTKEKKWVTGEKSSAVCFLRIAKLSGE